MSIPPDEPARLRTFPPACLYTFRARRRAPTQAPANLKFYLREYL
jgi:hypothetical protein